jgi:hypothetical protein
MAIQSMVLDPPVQREVRAFAGTLAQIPSGWQLCDGTNNTPDLRDKFIRIVAAGENPGLTGGANTHTHTTHASQTHSGGAVGTIAATATAAVKIGTAGATGAANTHTHPAPTFTQPTAHPTLSHEESNNVPAYYKLAFLTRPEWWS